ncbi:MAG: hypothetical protein K1X29_07285 [Bdellovibrionales bacterium]|nr:hypothetical protein [Bdellovibrionales bacterium]
MKLKTTIVMGLMLSFGLLSGCSKCSEQPTTEAPPAEVTQPAPEAAQAPAAAAPDAGQMPAEPSAPAEPPPEGGGD